MHADSQIRRLTADDVDLLRQLNAVFAAAFDDEHTYTGAPPDEAYCRRTLSKDDVIVLVALQEASVVGGLVAYELDKLERARREIYIYDWPLPNHSAGRGLLRC
jgi:aminoglycoside 3-N-acetyltransferase I